MLDNSLLIRPTLLAACGAALMAATAPVAASGNEANRSATAPDSPATNSQPEKKYCVSYTITGSILPQRECRTRADWEARGATLKTVAHKERGQTTE